MNVSLELPGYQQPAIRRCEMISLKKLGLGVLLAWIAVGGVHVPSGISSVWLSAGVDTAGVAGMVIPVELTSFTARAGDGIVTLNWTTQSETENLGYHVYRSMAKAGEYERITATRIEGAGSSRTTRTYRFVDQDVQPGKTYFYKVEQIDFTGQSEKYGPIEVTLGKATAVQRSTWGSVKSAIKRILLLK
jgi:hypothetical protein